MRIPIFIVYGTEHVASIRGMLLPALRLQNTRDALAVYLVNYQGTTSFFDQEISDTHCQITDISCVRASGALGFGEGMNAIFATAEREAFFIMMNPDAIPEPGCVAALVARYQQGKTGIVEARQWPSEHPKEYDMHTGITPWASGACALVDSEIFAAIGGFDPIYFMYCEDVDLSWQMWLRGREVIYAPEAAVTHHTGLFYYREDRYYLEHFYSARNFLILARKFLGDAGEQKALRMLRRAPFTKSFIETVKESYLRIRDHVAVQQGAHPHIRIRAFGRYHALRSDA